MEFFRRTPAAPSRLGILPGTFNPITVAHLSLAHAAAEHVEEIVWVLPRALPHKEYTGASFVERIDMLMAALRQEPRCSIAASEGGLFAEIADECRAAYGAQARLTFLCGRDAAERIAGWNYGQPGEFTRMLRQFDLLVAARGGEYVPPSEWQSAIRPLPLGCDLEEISSSAVRERIARKQPWEHLVPEAVRDLVRRIYCGPGA
jgi:nicotinate-nucleotide adenylyltransferase